MHEHEESGVDEFGYPMCCQCDAIIMDCRYGHRRVACDGATGYPVECCPDCHEVDGECESLACPQVELPAVTHILAPEARPHVDAMREYRRRTS